MAYNEKKTLIATKKQTRNVLGSDTVVSYLQSRNLILVTLVQANQSLYGRVPQANLSSFLGLEETEDCLHFLKNNNLQDAHRCMRGCLLLVNNEVGLVVRSTGTFIQFQVILPKPKHAKWRMFDLAKRELNHGFFLQQIHGPLVGRLTCTCRQRCKPYPYVVDGYLYMDPAGPHCFLPIPESQVPKSLVDRFHSMGDNLTTTNYHRPTSSSIKRRRRSPMGNILYVVRVSGDSTEMGDHSNKFFIPIGKPYNHRSHFTEQKEGNYSE
jgi:hypothetical protein